MNIKNKQEPLADTSNSNAVPLKKEYKAPALTEYGVITNFVNRRVLNGTDGGLPVDNDT